jgi:thiamine biosynthesis protein ThiC
MSKMKELDEIAQGIADVTKELMYDSIDWQLADFPQDGDDYNAIHAQVMDRAIEYLYKQNTNTVG